MHQAAIKFEQVGSPAPWCACAFQNASAVNVGIAKTARKRLKASPHTPLRSIRCEVHEGVLVLRGQVTSYYIKQLAQETVRTLEGVGAIINVVEVTGTERFIAGNCHCTGSTPLRRKTPCWS
jgi:BON domain